MAYYSTEMKSTLKGKYVCFRRGFVSAIASLIPSGSMIPMLVKTMLKTPASIISFSQREKTFFRHLGQELIKTTKMSKSGCYKQVLLEYHARSTQSAVIRGRSPQR